MKERHLCRGILHRHSVGFKLEVRYTSNICAVLGVREKGFFRIVEMGVEDFFGESQLPVWAQDSAYFMEPLDEFLIWRRSRANVGFRLR